jgi:2-iminobutanoate/2-iminopropanoate deaminase
VSQLEVVRTERAPSAIGPYSQAIVCDGWVYCSGQVALDPKTGELVGKSAAEQTERALRNLTAVLEAAGSSLSRVVKTTVFLADMADFQAMNEVYARHFAEHRPARATVQAAGLPKAARVEIECVARTA